MLGPQEAVQVVGWLQVAVVCPVVICSEDQT